MDADDGNDGNFDGADDDDDDDKFDDAAGREIVRIEVIGRIFVESVPKRFFKLFIDGPFILMIGMPNSLSFSLRIFVMGKKLVKPNESIFFRMFTSLKLTIGMPKSCLLLFVFTLSACIL